MLIKILQNQSFCTQSNGDNATYYDACIYLTTIAIIWIGAHKIDIGELKLVI